MSADQPTSELTTRDVLTQVDRRVSLIERDVRELRDHVDSRFDEAGRENSQQFTESRRENADRFTGVESKFTAMQRETSQESAGVRAEATALRNEVNAQFAAMRAEANARWRWTVGLIIVTARSDGCTHLLSEDLNPGQVICGVRVVHPTDADTLLSTPARTPFRVEPRSMGEPTVDLANRDELNQRMEE